MRLEIIADDCRIARVRPMNLIHVSLVVVEEAAAGSPFEVTIGGGQTRRTTAGNKSGATTDPIITSIGPCVCALIDNHITSW